MAFTPTKFLSNNTNVLLRDPQHAARLFVDDQFRLAPKHKFLFHVAFSINVAALQNLDLVQRHRNEINMLVKNCDLPSYTVQTDTLNQYNRKKNIQTTHRYNPINIVFHDDNMGIINQLWQNYYKYYYADPNTSEGPAAYKRNATKSYDFVKGNYGLDNNSTVPFFNYIILYQMARHEFVSYKLYNPIISSWNHNKVDYGQTSTHDNTMQIQYEAVSYDTGLVEVGNPEGFALEHYDQGKSPLQAGSQETLTSASPSLVNSSANVSTLSVLQNAIQTVNNYQNSPVGTVGGIRGIITNAASAPNQSSNIPGVVFPSSVSPQTTPASPISSRL
jgi:hypothetical protein